jgi:two-component system sensor histidine kinase and response regulator WspE
MSGGDQEDLSQRSMLELFRAEAETQTAVLTSGFLELERSPAASELLEKLMRAAHSLKGAARIVNLPEAVRVAHAMEDCFVAAQRGLLHLSRREVDVLFRGVDLFAQLSRRSESGMASWAGDCAGAIDAFLRAAADLLKGGPPDEPPAPAMPPVELMDPELALPYTAVQVSDNEPSPAAMAASRVEAADRVVRLAAESLNRLLGLAGESLVESRWLRPFAESFQGLRRQQDEIAGKLEALRRGVEKGAGLEGLEPNFRELFQELARSQQFIVARMQELDAFDRRTAHLSHRLYLEVLRTRMRPFSDGVRRFPRMVRDLAHSLGKEIRLEVTGENTQVDRDILDRLEAPLAHLLRNAVDHGCEPPAERQKAGKPVEGVVRLEARHSAGVLLVSVSDDGMGVPLERVREAAIRRGMVSSARAARLAEHDVLQFLLVPGFTLKETVTEISGRGVGLDVVEDMVRSLRGSLRMANQPGRGFRVQLQLPLTLSVLRALLVEAGGEPYALPLSRVGRTFKLSRRQVSLLDGRPQVSLAGHSVGLLGLGELFELPPAAAPSEDLHIVLLEDRYRQYGLVVDRFLGERELVVQPLDPRLGKVRDVSACALMENGAPVLVLEVDELLRSMEERLQRPPPAASEATAAAPAAAKRVLVVDDSATVRQMQRKLLAEHGYEVDTAVDGLDGWNLARTSAYDLLITDIDMPRMDGIELVGAVRADPRLKAMPVLVLSYKSRPQDRLRGMEAGADYYLAKSDLSDDALLRAVSDLIGEAGA